MRTCELFDCKVPYLESFFKAHKFPWAMLPKISRLISDIVSEYPSLFSEVTEGVYAAENVSIHESAVINGPVIIGSGCEIRPGAFIRGNVIIGAKCVIGNSTELKNCILLDNVQVPHYNYVGDSILGNNSHLGAGAICSNLKADKKTVIVHGDSDYTTNLKKVGAFLGDGADIGCGCVLNPGTVVGKKTSAYPLTFLRGVYPENCIIKGSDNVVKRI